MTLTLTHGAVSLTLTLTLTLNADAEKTAVCQHLEAERRPHRTAEHHPHRLLAAEHHPHREGNHRRHHHRPHLVQNRNTHRRRRRRDGDRTDDDRLANHHLYHLYHLYRALKMAMAPVHFGKARVVAKGRDDEGYVDGLLWEHRLVRNDDEGYVDARYDDVFRALSLLHHHQHHQPDGRSPEAPVGAPDPRVTAPEPLVAAPVEVQPTQRTDADSESLVFWDPWHRKLHL